MEGMVVEVVGVVVFMVVVTTGVLVAVTLGVISVAGVPVGIAVGVEIVGRVGSVETVVVVSGGTKVIVCCVLTGGKKVVSVAGGSEVRETEVVVTGEGQAASSGSRTSRHVSPNPTLTPTFDINGIIALSKLSYPIA